LHITAFIITNLCEMLVNWNLMCL